MPAPETLAPPLAGWAHPTGAGIRRRLLVIPSVICAAQAAQVIADSVPGAVAIQHQHGCAQLGGDARLTHHVLTQLGAHPNVAAVLVVSLGCETVQGAALHRAIAGRGQRAAFVGIQQAGGTLAAVEAGRAALARLSREVEADPPAALGWEALIVGVEAGWERASAGQASAVTEMIARLRAAGATVIQAAPGPAEEAAAWWAVRYAAARGPAAPSAAAGRPVPGAASLPYATRPAGPGLYAMGSPASRIAQKTGLAAAGAHVIVSPLVCGLPAGSPVAPVVHLGIAPYAHAFAADVDVMLEDRPGMDAPGAAIAALLAACRAETALEAMGDFEMGIHRIGPTM